MFHSLRSRRLLSADTTAQYEKTYAKSKENPGGSPKDPLIYFKSGDIVTGKKAAKAEPTKEEAPKKEDEA